ncbi:MAG TPA: RNA-guided pseudouridylation complex pseudouridine synthase subunit Cbf5, partial [Candidatus Binatus sp.]|nr:RNA-guided pseudouridylation complex pseudouridine synthase subunit Cbf5 [Candidatus Binatus sp.]
LTGKEYVCLMTLHDAVPTTKLASVLEEFVGEIYQKPPLRAAVKREVRKRRIYYIKDIEVQDRHVLFRVGCQSGTYIRKLVSDIGDVLGVGAHMRELRRTRAGPFTEDGIRNLYDILELSMAKTLDEKEALTRKIIRPMEAAAEYLQKIYMRDSAVNAICHGAELAVPGIVKLTDGIRVKSTVALLTLKGELVALGSALMSSDEIIRNEKGLAAKPVRVVMPPDTYPRMWKHRTPTGESPPAQVMSEGTG